MKNITKLLIFYGALMVSPIVNGQFSDYKYQRQVLGVTQQWHRINIPSEVFGNTSQNLSDIRIFGITTTLDTIEVPFILKPITKKASTELLPFQRLNTSQKDDGHYFTFEVPLEATVNRINLDFNNENFDWIAKLEGSNDLREWFTIVDNYRILGVKNEEVTFRYTDLKFPDSRYRYFRMRVGGSDTPILKSATISKEEYSEGQLENYKIKSILTSELKERKETEITITLEEPGRPALLQFNITAPLEYYRPFVIRQLSDSLNTEKGWLHQYTSLETGVINSMEENRFSFPGTTTKQLKLTIKNSDNQPLAVDNIQVKGYVHQITARFSQPATYFLAYGNPNAIHPRYDIVHFEKRIPENLPYLELGEELIIPQQKSDKPEPLFVNRKWLWSIMALIMLVLGWFTLKMIQQKETPSEEF